MAQQIIGNNNDPTLFLGNQLRTVGSTAQKAARAWKKAATEKRLRLAPALLSSWRERHSTRFSIGR